MQSKIIINYFRYYFHYINSTNYGINLTFMCMCDNKLSQDTAFSYLEELKNQLIETFSTREIDTAIAYSLNDKFRESIKGKMNYYNAHLNDSDNVSKLKKGVIDYKDTVMQANDVLMERGEKINLIVKKADNLRQESVNYFGSVNILLLNFYFRQKKLNQV